ncbi:MAG: DPP IV N-terminal domain-containing protein, partial [Chitinophagaceae bacterium]
MKNNNGFRRFCPALLAGLLVISAARSQPQSSLTNEERYESYLRFQTLVSGVYVRPVWLPDGNRFWFAGGSTDSTVIYEVDPHRNTQKEVFDTKRLRAALRQALAQEPAGKGIPFTDFEFAKDAHSIVFKAAGEKFLLKLRDYTIIPLFPSADETIPEPKQFSPDRKRFVFARDNNLWLGDAESSQTKQLTDDGLKDYAWRLPAAAWSPDGTRLFIQRLDDRKVHHLPVINYSKPVEEVEWSIYAKTGGALEIPELYVLDAAGGQKIKIDVGVEREQYVFPLGWRPDGSELIFMRLNRTGKKLELLAANPATGSARIILAEESQTFVAGLDFITERWVRQFTLLQDGHRFLWLSERDGWRHLYLYDMNGALIRRLTAGAFPVIEPIKVDEKAGWIYLRANAEPDLYSTQLYRVSLEGKHFKRLTEASGSHYFRMAPSGQYFIDAHSSPSRRPVVELRSTDGGLLRVIRTADTSRLHQTGWTAPQPFIVKAADSTTDLYGILYKPADFDPSKKYPVVEFIYGGQFMTVVPRGFIPNTGLSVQAQALAQLGYITFLVDGRGTTERDKAFQDVVYGNVGKYEIPDHVAALKQLAASRPYMDTSRVGILGHSWGGYFAIRALLQAPEVYKAGIASAPGQLTEGAEVIEPYMGLPADNPAGYRFGANTNLAANLQGKLLFIHGTSDVNAP